MWRRAVPGVSEKPDIPSFVLATVRVLVGSRAGRTIWKTTDMFKKTVKQCIRLESSTGQDDITRCSLSGWWLGMQVRELGRVK